MTNLILPNSISADRGAASLSPQLYQQPRSLGGLNRRTFLQGLLGVGGLAALGLPMINEDVDAAPLGPDERVLVLIHLDGGNDGLNTVVPLEDGAYFDARGDLAVSPEGAHDIGDGLYLHPNLGGIKGLWDEGKVAVINGVGEPLNDRSHFTQIARWMAATSEASPWYHGWLGRFMDLGNMGDMAGIVLDHRGIPLHMARATSETTVLPPNGNLFGADVYEDGQLSHTSHVYSQLQSLGFADIGKGPWAQALASSASSAISVAQAASPVFSPEIPDDTDELVTDLTLAARLINLNIGARILSVRISGFDTHSGQRPDHDYMLSSIDQGVTALMSTLTPEWRDRTTVMTFSEFGRRVAANGSAGTDHGTASCMFVIGDKVAGGKYGAYPSLTSLDYRGDLVHEVDFRSVYTSVLDGWLDADSAEVLGTSYENLNLFTTNYCEGFAPTHMGTPGDDVLEGTPEQDVFMGLSGNDVIYGRGGDDIICGGDGHDTLFGGDGNDQVFGGSGNDDLSGGAGNDMLSGQDGNDQVRGGRGADTLTGDEGSDQLFGKRRDDSFLTDALDVIVRGQ